jgi:hypothetical protein
MNISSTVMRYFTASYQYYVAYEDTGMSDYEYDILCKHLYDNFDLLTPDEQSVLSKESLSAGTGFDISLDVYKKVGVINE